MTTSKRTSLSPIAAVIAITLLALAGHASAEKPDKPGAPEGSIVAKHGWLHVEGNRIVDKNGKPVALHGMSLFWSQWMGQYYNADAVKWLRDDWGCTVVRAAMAVESGGYLKNPKREKQKVFDVVQAAIDLGIYVIVDWHDHNAHKHTREAKAFFAELAKAYGKYPNVLYETWNEPLNTHDWSKVIKPYHQAVIPAIRQHAPDGLILCGTQTWSQDVDKAARDPLKFRNVAYVLHFYAATHKQSLRDKAAAALEAGVALMVTEWGTSEASGSGKLDYAETQKWLEFMDRRKLTWCNWSLADKRETSAALEPRASGKGGWLAKSLSRSGALLRKELRARSPLRQKRPISTTTPIPTR